MYYEICVIDIGDIQGGGDLVVNMARFRKRFKAWQKKMDALAPKVGNAAPDFELRDTNGENVMHLSDFRGKKPVALAFGSYT